MFFAPGRQKCTNKRIICRGKTAHRARHYLRVPEPRPSRIRSRHSGADLRRRKPASAVDFRGNICNHHVTRNYFRKLYGGSQDRRLLRRTEAGCPAWLLMIVIWRTKTQAPIAGGIKPPHVLCCTRYTRIRDRPLNADKYTGTVTAPPDVPLFAAPQLHSAVITKANAARACIFVRSPQISCLNPYHYGLNRHLSFQESRWTSGWRCNKLRRKTILDKVWREH